MNRKAAFLVGGLPVLLAAYLLLLANSYSLCLWTKGYHPQSTSVIHENTDNNGDTIQLVQLVERGTGKEVLAHLVKNKWNWWNLALLYDQTDKHGMQELLWNKALGIQTYGLGETLFVWEQHVIFTGTNATSLIRFREGQLPDNLTVGIAQSTNKYTLHFISLGDPDTLIQQHRFLQNSLYDLLKENDCVE